MQAVQSLKTRQNNFMVGIFRFKDILKSRRLPKDCVDNAELICIKSRLYCSIQDTFTEMILHNCT